MFIQDIHYKFEFNGFLRDFGERVEFRDKINIHWFFELSLSGLLHFDGVCGAEIMEMWRDVLPGVFKIDNYHCLDWIIIKYVILNFHEASNTLNLAPFSQKFLHEIMHWLENFQDLQHFHTEGKRFEQEIIQIQNLDFKICIQGFQHLFGLNIFFLIIEID